jgi:hypothetical protein
MRGVIWNKNGIGVALVTRSGSHCLFGAILETHYVEPIYTDVTAGVWHPVRSLPANDIIDISKTAIPNQLTFAVVVRNPIDRFRSACARIQKTPREVIETSLENVHVWTIESMGLLDHPQARYYLFEKLEDCARFLGLPTPLVQVNQEPLKPELTDEELDFVTQHYASDISLYNRLLQG